MVKNKKIIIAYVPVLHDGYKLLFKKHKNAETLYIFGEEIISKFDYLSKEIRALSPEDVKKAVESWGIFPNIVILDKENVESLRDKKIIMPDEDVCHLLAEEYFKESNIEFDPIFLRWNRTNTRKKKEVGPEHVLTKNEFMNSAFIVAEKSSDWWRQIGAVIVKDGEIVLSRTNKHVPSPHQAYADGDPRNVSHKGKDLDLYTTIHTEAGLVADAAKDGIALLGAEMYVTDFPCPICAKQIAVSGIKKLYYTRGYDVLDGKRILKDAGVEIIQIKKTTE